MHIVVLGLATYMIVHSLYVLTFKPSSDPVTIAPREISPSWRFGLTVGIGQALAWIWWVDTVFPLIDGLVIAFVAGAAESAMGALWVHANRSQ